MFSARAFCGRLLAFIAVCAICLTAPSHSSSQQPAKRLILKDGSYQLVTQYEVKGDRVRYMSSERNEWEELPSDLVDWPATERYEKERATSAIPDAVAIDKETDADREAEEAHLPEVAPGLHLPEDSGVFLLDNYQGQPQIVELQQTEGDVSQNARANILRGVLGPLAAGRQAIELEGAHAAIHSHASVPSIYINIADETPAPALSQAAPAGESQPSANASRAQQPQQPQQATVPFDRFHIVLTKVKNGKRIVGDLKVTTPGKVTPDEPFVKTTIDSIKGGWLKLTPTADLAPGEYALVETQGNVGMNLYVWDFNVDPKAPANANPWTPSPNNTNKAAAKPGADSK